MQGQEQQQQVGLSTSPIYTTRRIARHTHFCHPDVFEVAGKGPNGQAADCGRQQHIFEFELIHTCMQQTADGSN